MPVKVLDGLPAIDFLRKENIFMVTKSCVKIQITKTLKILILNLMPKKVETENQLLRLLSNSPLQIDIQLLRVDQRRSKNTSMEHLNNFYCNFIDIQSKNYDGLVVTGAPLGLIRFCDVVFWKQMKEIIKWAMKHVTSTLFICWAVQAALNILYGVPQITRRNRLAGVYRHYTIHPHASLTRGFDGTFLAIHSRHADFPSKIIRNNTDLKILVEAENEDIGAYLLASQDKRIVCVTGHPEYDATTLASEYYRDRLNGLNPTLPVNYFPKDNPNSMPESTWRSHGYLLFNNWLNYYIHCV
ncbi:homoserine O-succinyltransferase [Blochmannia endosymbiont of Colobopsis nipponica]|uniref:homoserine O-succinyltransferase n=1 Tax=Blochmannia endosymbiont of Colobopsis nipponica TaxID=2681987 RepID=UPI0017805FB8|nr:homoserine O-succinyltransferase [Blochmannia endosymbiont of Colobopsis nipponica]QOI10844.1 homoserine O-succinyltransferase [Blochmannia endosymbiont of Colobopsis nipponica]